MTQEIKIEPPRPLAQIAFNIAPAFRTTLKNGLRVVIFENRRLPIVSFRLAFLSGDIDDPADQIGSTAALASMLTEGTVNYSSRDLAEKIERLGASLAASSSDDFTIVSASTLSLYCSDILEMMEEIIFRPTFPENELDLYRRNGVEHLRFQRSQPSFLANEQTARLIYGDHPYSRIAPSPEDIEKLTREGLSEMLRTRFVPNNAVMVVVGDVEKDAVLNEIEGRFGEWRPGAAAKQEYSFPGKRSSRELVVVDRPGSAQSNIVLANLALPRNHPDYFAVAVMNQVLGAGASSRLFMNLREEKGYTYGAYSRIDAKRYFGDFEATAEVRTAVTGDSLREFFLELDRIRDEIVPDQEMADAKNFLTGVFPIRAETQEGLTNLIVSQELYGLPEDYLQTYRDNIAAITAEDVRRVANEYIHPDQVAIVAVGDAVEIVSQAGGHAASVKVVDAEGKPKELAPPAAATGDPADFSGLWKLDLDFQGQSVPVSLSIEQSDSGISGSIETILGNGSITSGEVIGQTISATAATEIQGQSVEFVIKGQLSDGGLNGTISTAIIPDSLTFTGKRADQAGVSN